MRFHGACVWLVVGWLACILCSAAASSPALPADCQQAETHVASALLHSLMGGGGAGGPESPATESLARAAELCPSNPDYALRYAATLAPFDPRRTVSELQRALALVSRDDAPWSPVERTRITRDILAQWMKLGSKALTAAAAATKPLLPLPPSTFDEDNAASAATLPRSLRLLWPTPLYGSSVPDLVAPFHRPLLDLMQRWRDDESPTDRSKRNAHTAEGIQKGFATRAELFWTDEADPSTHTHSSPIRRACRSGVELVDRYCLALSTRLHGVLRHQSPSSLPLSAGDLDVELLHGSLHLDGNMDAHRPRSEDIVAAAAAATEPPANAATGAGSCDGRRQVEWSAPAFLTVWLMLSRDSSSHMASARGLSIDDELSFADPRPQAAPLSPAGFMHADEPLRLKLDVGELVVAPSWIARTMAPYTGRTHRMWSEWTIAVRTRSDMRADEEGQEEGQCSMPAAVASTAAASTASSPALSSSLFYRWATPVYHVALHLDPMDRASINSALLSEILALRAESAGTSHTKSNRGGWHSKLALLDAPAPSMFATLRSLILQHVHAYLRAVSQATCHRSFLHPHQPLCRAFDYASLESDLSSKLVITQSWSIVNAQGHFNMMHTHPGAVVSGVYYVQSGAAHARRSNLHFRAPGPLATIYGDRAAIPHSWIEPLAPSSSSSSSLLSGTDVMEPLEAGNLVLFPGWLEHYVAPHYSAAVSAAESDADRLDAASESDANLRVCISFNVKLA